MNKVENEKLCVLIQRGNAGAQPVFCLPGAGACVTSFMPLAAALGSQTPVFGLQPRGLDGLAEPFRDVQDAANTYLLLIKRVAQHRPFKLIGHSFGGWIAFEIARQLERECECRSELETPLILVDSQGPSDNCVLGADCCGPDALAKLVQILEQACGRSLRVSRQDFESLAQAEQMSLLARAMATAGLISSRIDIAVIAAMVRVFEANVNTKYVPASPLRGPATLVLASEPSSGMPRHDRADPVVAWRVFAPRLTSAPVPGNHMSMLAASHVAALANIVQGHPHAEPQIV